MDINHNEIDVIDERKEELHRNAKQTEQNRLNFLRIPDIFGNLLNNERFVKEYSKSIEAIYKEPNIHKLMTLINQDNQLI